MTDPVLVARIERWGNSINIVTVNSKVVEQPNGEMHIYALPEGEAPKAVTVPIEGRKFKVIDK